MNLFKEMEEVFVSGDYDKIDKIIEDKSKFLEIVSGLIQKQIKRIRTSENSPKNSKLYFGLLLETSDLVNATMNLMELFKEFNNYVETKK